MENFFNHSTSYSLINSIEYADGAIVSKIVKKNDAGNITLFAFDKGQLLSEHTAPFDAMVNIIEGVGLISINKVEYELKAGDFIIMPANIPHAVVAKDRFKMLLIMLKN
ncbi:MAG: cupin domain-containing protein [Bacteroidales bacterium]|nr:cupin domain-containing protein [Bacteroidales bacterium]